MDAAFLDFRLANMDLFVSSYGMLNIDRFEKIWLFWFLHCPCGSLLFTRLFLTHRLHASNWFDSSIGRALAFLFTAQVTFINAFIFNLNKSQGFNRPGRPSESGCADGNLMPNCVCMRCFSSARRMAKSNMMK